MSEGLKEFHSLKSFPEDLTAGLKVCAQHDRRYRKISIACSSDI